MITKEFLTECLKKGMSVRDIEKLPNVNMAHSTIYFYVKKYGLNKLNCYSRLTYNEDFFDEINTKEKAYILGYTLADGYISYKIIEYGCALTDKELLDFIAKELGGRVKIDTYFNKETRRFPRARINIGNKKLIRGLIKHSVGIKDEKTFPHIRKDLEPYMLLGFFDGDGCITWGRRKDRNRIWQKVNFTGSYKLLYAIQKLFISLGITSGLRPKSGCNCYMLELSSKKDVLNALKYMYGDEKFIVLHRKFDKYNALRLELGEIGEGTDDNVIMPSQVDDHSSKGVETIGEKKVSLNNRG